MYKGIFEQVGEQRSGERGVHDGAHSPLLRVVHLYLFVTVCQAVILYECTRLGIDVYGFRLRELAVVYLREQQERAVQSAYVV